MKTFFLVLGTCIFLGCSTPNWTRGEFYHWQTTLDSQSPEYQALGPWKTKTIFLRLFDLDHDQGSWTIKGPLKVIHPLPDTLEWVPVVYITTQALKHIDTLDLPWLWTTMEAYFRQVSPQAPQEIQIDADWAPSTRAGYFSFLEAFQNLPKMKNLLLTITLRLHQIRDTQTMGIPPVRRGVLMAYGMGDPRNFQGPNQVLDPGLLKGYLENHLAAYPLDLDLALPLYSQARLFNPFEKLTFMTKVISPVDLGPGFDHVQDHWIAGHETRLRDRAVMKGDLLIIDEPTLESLTLAANLFKKSPRTAGSRILFFDLSNLTTRRTFSHEVQTHFFP